MRDLDKLKEKGKIELSSTEAYFLIGGLLILISIVFFAGYWVCRYLSFGSDRMGKGAKNEVGLKLDGGELSKLLTSNNNDRVENPIGEPEFILPEILPQKDGVGMGGRLETFHYAREDASEGAFLEKDKRETDEALRDSGIIEVKQVSSKNAGTGGEIQKVEVSRKEKRGWTVQVASHKDEEVAKELLQRLNDKGFDGFITYVTLKGERWYRVRVGSCERMKECEEVKRRVEETGWGLHPIITQND